jgi:hypothetical protein
MDCRPRRVLHFLEEIDHSDSSPVRSAGTTHLSGSSFKVASLDRLILASDCGRMTGHPEVTELSFDGKPAPQAVTNVLSINALQFISIV